MNVFDAGNTKSDWAFIYGEKIMTIMLSRFNLIPERDGQTDGRNYYLLYQYRVSVLTRDKN